MSMSVHSTFVRLTTLALLAAPPVFAQEASDLAKDLSNPVSSLISLPYQLNSDSGLGPDGEGSRTVVNIQPVVPFSVGEDWNLISRTIIPLVRVEDVVPGETNSGTGDVLQSFFLSPKQPTAGGLIWGAGPVFLLPTASDGLGAEQFAMGVTGVVLKQSGPWTFGALGNHLWDVGGGSDSTEINTTFLQPFVSYTTPDALTVAFNTEASYDWVTDEASVPLNLVVSKVVKLGPNLVSIGGGVRDWADGPENGPDGWGARAIVTFLFPK